MEKKISELRLRNINTYFISLRAALHSFSTIRKMDKTIKFLSTFVGSMGRCQQKNIMKSQHNLHLPQSASTGLPINSLKYHVARSQCSWPNQPLKTTKQTDGTERKERFNLWLLMIYFCASFSSFFPHPLLTFNFSLFLS